MGCLSALRRLRMANAKQTARKRAGGKALRRVVALQAAIQSSEGAGGAAQARLRKLTPTERAWLSHLRNAATPYKAMRYGDDTWKF